MTAIILDNKFPIIALVGDFNEAIFSTAWIGTNLFGLADGEEVTACEIVADLGGGPLQLLFLKSVALNVTAKRIDFFVLDPSEETVATLEGVLLRLFEVLPHTPFRAMGCNLHYRDDEPTSDRLDLFNTPEAIEAEYRVVMRQVSAQIDLDNGSVLNFQRGTDGNRLALMFNYHQDARSVERYKEIVPGLLQRSLEHSSEFLRSLYGFDEIVPHGFITPDQLKETMNDKPEANASAVAHEENASDSA